MSIVASGIGMTVRPLGGGFSLVPRIERRTAGREIRYRATLTSPDEAKIKPVTEMAAAGIWRCENWSQRLTDRGPIRMTSGACQLQDEFQKEGKCDGRTISDRVCQHLSGNPHLLPCIFLHRLSTCTSRSFGVGGAPPLDVHLLPPIQRSIPGDNQVATKAKVEWGVEEDSYDRDEPKDTIFEADLVRSIAGLNPALHNERRQAHQSPSQKENAPSQS